jgi:hypothetical protein
VKDPSKPENEGKVFLYRYGKKIFEKLNDLMSPRPEEGEEPVNPFDLWNGANFKLKIRKVDGYRNYDKSEFESPSPLLDDDDELEKVWKSEYSLKEFHDKKNFKSYDALKARLAVVLGDNRGSDASDADEDVAETKKAAPPKKEKAAPPKKEKAAKSKAVEEDDNDEEDDEEGGLGFFAKLAAEEDEE